MEIGKIRNSIIEFKKAFGISNFSKELTDTEFNLIAIVNEYCENEQNINLTTISDKLNITRSAVTQLATKLELKGYIEKYTLESNKKEIYLKIGNKAIKQYQFIMDQVSIFFERLFNEVGQEGIDNIQKYIDIAKKIGKEMKEEIELHA